MLSKHLLCAQHCARAQAEQWKMGTVLGVFAEDSEPPGSQDKIVDIAEPSPEWIVWVAGSSPKLD